MKFIFSGNQLELTDAMREYAEKKLLTLEKFSDKISEAKVILGMETHHHNKGEIFFVECRLSVPGNDLFAKNTSKDLYAAIDLVKDELESELRKYKEKNKGVSKKSQNEARENKEYDGSEE